MAGQLRFIPVAERELRVMARRRRTYLIRWGSVAVFFAFLVWLTWVVDGFRRSGVGSDIFQTFSTVVFFYCLIVGTAQTADCISSEKREGTLGLLFLTNLNSAEIVAGKLCSTALPTVYGLLGIFPLLGLPLLMGGVTVADFWKTMLALLDAILFSLACGFMASVLCRRQFTAIAFALALAIGVGTGLMAAAAIADELNLSKSLVDGFSVLSPLYTLMSADGGRTIGRPNLYWQSLASVAGVSLLGLGFVTWRLSRVWQDRPKAARVSFRFGAWPRWKKFNATGRALLRRRLLDINPFYWLAGRSCVSSPGFMIVILLLVLVTVHVSAPYFASLIPAGTLKPMAGSVFAWFFTGLLIHVLALYYAAMISSQRLAEDKQTGALELILSTPTTERDISRGLWLAFARRMFFPALIAVLVHFYFIWQVLHTMMAESSSLRLPRNYGAWELFWGSLMANSANGNSIEWHFGFMMQFALLFLAMAVVIWFTLGLVARWLGLRMKLAGFAPLVSLALVFIPPVILFSVLAYIADDTNLLSGGDRQTLPVLLWSGFSLGVIHCILLCTWASGKLRDDFRSAVVGRSETLRRKWLPSIRTVLRFVGGSAAYLICLTIVLTGFYGCRNYQGKRNWDRFQARLEKKGESLEVAPLLGAPVADSANFARSPAFSDFKGSSYKSFLPTLESVNGVPRNPSGKPGIEWMEQRVATLAGCLPAMKAKPSNATNAAANAHQLLKLFQTRTNTFNALAVAARLPSLRFSTNHNALAVIQNPGSDDVAMFERLHFLFVVRSLALLKTGRAPESADDFLTSLHFARLSRQSPDMKSSTRTQEMLARSFQPLWEGLMNHAWSEAQLAEFESRLLQFNLLADHTNAIRRVALAYIETWKHIAESGGGREMNPSWRGGNMNSSSWGNSKVWWLASCIQLHQIAEDVCGRVDVSGERVDTDDNWQNLSELPMDSEANGLFGQYYWQANNPSLVGFAQTSLNQARFAIALERFRIANGKYPKTADELVPVYLERIPRDSMRGLPLIYQRLDDDHYILRGTGQDRKDDRNSNGPNDDWLWAYSTNAPVAVKMP